MKVEWWSNYDELKKEGYVENPNYEEAQQAVAEELRKNGLYFNSEYHHFGKYGVPVFDDGTIFLSSQRGWGRTMMYAHPDEIESYLDYWYIFGDKFIPPYPDDDWIPNMDFEEMMTRKRSVQVDDFNPCNCFDDRNKVVLGHDYGAAVWIQKVRVKVSEKILPEDVDEVGEEISVEKAFFDRILKPIFLKLFDADMMENKNRFTYAFSDEGRYLRGFEEDILERNFYTCGQIKAILGQVEDVAGETAEMIKKEGAPNEDMLNEVEQMRKFAKLMKLIMEANPDVEYFSVMS